LEVLLSEPGVEDVVDFNTSKVRLEASLITSTANHHHYFNTSKVRLEAELATKMDNANAHFNTSKVRLEDH